MRGAVQVEEVDVSKIIFEEVTKFNRVYNIQVHHYLKENVRLNCKSEDIKRMLFQLLKTSLHGQAQIRVDLEETYDLIFFAVHNFREFPMGEPAASEKEKSLAFVRDYAEALGGHLVRESDQRLGTTLIVFLPKFKA
jgi:hypothetical protein